MSRFKQAKSILWPPPFIASYSPIVAPSFITSSHANCASSSRTNLSSLCVCQQSRSHSTLLQRRETSAHEVASGSLETKRKYHAAALQLQTTDDTASNTMAAEMAAPERRDAVEMGDEPGAGHWSHRTKSKPSEPDQKVPRRIQSARNRAHRKLAMSKSDSADSIQAPSQPSSTLATSAGSATIPTAQSAATTPSSQSSALLRSTLRLDRFGHAMPTSLPDTPAALLSLFVKLASLRAPRVPVTDLVALHSHARFAHLVSPGSYSYLLHLATRRVSNDSLVRFLLDEMDSRGVEKTREVWQVVLEWEAKRARPGAVAHVVRAMDRAGYSAWPAINWRRNMGLIGKGRGDKAVAWKGRRTQDLAPVGGDLDREVMADRSRRRSWRVDGRSNDVVDSVTTYGPLDGLLRRPARVQIPRNAESLSAADIAALIESLVQGKRPAEALDTAQAWLDHRRAQVVSADIDQAEKLNSTAIVLLNILLKALVATRASTKKQRTFVLGFIHRNSSTTSSSDSLPASSNALKPNLATVRTMLSGLERRHQSWRQGLDLVIWFLRQFGPEPFAPASDPRPSNRQSKPLGPVRLRLDADVASLLLRLAMSDLGRAAPPSVPKFKRDVRVWWARLDKEPRTVTDTWLGRDVKEVELDAVELGLLTLELGNEAEAGVEEEDEFMQKDRKDRAKTLESLIWSRKAMRERAEDIDRKRQRAVTRATGLTDSRSRMRIREGASK